MLLFSAAPFAREVLPFPNADKSAENISHLTASFLRRINQRISQIKQTGNENRLKIKARLQTIRGLNLQRLYCWWFRTVPDQSWKRTSKRKHIYFLLRLRVLLIRPFCFQAVFLAVHLEVVPVPLIRCLRLPLRNHSEAGDTPFYPAYFWLDAKNVPKLFPLLSSAFAPAERRTSSL